MGRGQGGYCTSYNMQSHNRDSASSECQRAKAEKCCSGLKQLKDLLCAEPRGTLKTGDGQCMRQCGLTHHSEETSLSFGQHVALGPGQRAGSFYFILTGKDTEAEASVSSQQATAGKCQEGN